MILFPARVFQMHMIPCVNMTALELYAKLTRYANMDNEPVNAQKWK